METQTKEILLVCGAVITILAILAATIAFLWFKISDERKQRKSIQESEEYKAMERASSGYKQLYDVLNIHNENLQRDLDKKNKQLEDTQAELAAAQRRITSLIDNQITLNARIEVLERHQLAHVPNS